MSADVLAHGEGPKGTWHEVAPKALTVDQLAGLVTFLLDVPGDQPWHHYVMTAIHLHPIEGQTRPPVKRFPAATHEVMVLALDPKEPPEPPWPYILPPNVMAQFACTSDDIVRKVTRQAAEGVVNGVLPLEYPYEAQLEGGAVVTVAGAPGANRAISEYWQSSLAHTIEHHVTGGHP